MKRFTRSESGATVVELALILPLFLLLLFLIIEGSEVLGDWMILTNQTREAARYAVAGARDGDSTLVNEVQTMVQNNVSSVLTGPVSVTVSVASDGLQPTSVTVTTNYSVPMVTGFSQSALGAAVPISSTATMRAE